MHIHAVYQVEDGVVKLHHFLVVYKDGRKEVRSSFEPLTPNAPELWIEPEEF